VGGQVLLNGRLYKIYLAAAIDQTYSYSNDLHEALIKKRHGQLLEMPVTLTV